MQKKKKAIPKEKTRLHPRNKHREHYDFKQLIESYPKLETYVKPNAYGNESIDFFDPEAVLALNTALLKHYYAIHFWEIPTAYLCPPIPGRADYIHHISDLLAGKNYGKIPTGNSIRALDIGVGANCIYPIIGNKEYGWSFVGTEIDQVAIASAQQIVDQNSNLKDKIELRLQANPKDVFFGTISKEERFDLVICNPPFHASEKEAQAGTQRKLSNLTHEKVIETKLNFGGQSNELWCEGGEEKFVKNMIRESKHYANTCFWFSTLISKKANLNSAYQALKKEEANEVKTIPMGQGNKTSRLLAWTFLVKEQQQEWIKKRWDQ